MVLAGCAAETGGARPGEGEVADQLAPSQLTADTALPPATPPPCDPGALALWTAQVLVDGVASGATIRVRNSGAVWCEVNVGGSPGLDPAIEPTVWLDPGGWADLIVSPVRTDCGRAELRPMVTVDVGGDELGVPTALVGCGWRLSAFFPVDAPAGPCEELSAVAAEPFVVVRNDGASSCELGAVVGADGEPVRGAGGTDGTDGADGADGADGMGGTDGVDVVALAAGDVVAVRYEVPDEAAAGAPCDAGSMLVLQLAGAGPVPVAGLPCGAVVTADTAGPWFGDPAGPLAGLTDAPVGADAARAALDPFAGGAR